MKLLVTGGAGYIGSHTVREALKRGLSLVVMDNFSMGHRESLPDQVDLVEGDLRNKNDIEGAFRDHAIEGVLHFAADCSVGESVEKPDKYYENNLQASINLLQVMMAHGVKKIIFSSSAAVYGNPQTREITEELPRAPMNPYGCTKAFFEQILEDYHRAFGLKFVALRYFNAAGAHPDGILGEDHTPETHLIPRLLDSAMGKGPGAILFGTDYPTPDGTCVRDYIHICDLATAHLLAWERLDSLGAQCINLGTAKGASVLEVIQTVKEITGVDFPVDHAPRRAGDPPYLVTSHAKAKKLLDWEPEFVHLSEIVQTAWDWHRGSRWQGLSSKG